MFSRFRLPAAVRIAVVLAVAAAGVAGVSAFVPAVASGTQHQTGRMAARATVGRGAMIAPLARPGHLSRAAAGKAVSACLFYAAKAGWADNGYYAGDLVTAVAVCVAESGGDANLIVCDGAGGVVAHGDYPTFKCPEPATISYDRGLWQLSNVYDSKVTNTCAFDPVCNADQAYLASLRGISFDPWISYDTGQYAVPFLDLVQAAVTKLSNGTVTSALLGECLSAGHHARVVIANCGTGWSSERWSAAGGKLRSGSLCAAIASARGRANVVLSHCARSRAQDWAVFGRNELRNAADRKCLTDPGSSLTGGTQVDVTDCANAKSQTWWLP